MNSPLSPSRRRVLAGAAALSATGMLAACTDSAEQNTSDTANTGSDAGSGTLRISAIPDQDPDKLTERETALAEYLAEALGISVEYVAVPDYAASVSQFVTGDLDLVFYGGLTGVQARHQVPDAIIAGQRDIDEKFTSVFIAHPDAGISPVDDVAGLEALAGKRFTFGSETSTSGRLMPSYFLSEAGVTEADFNGEPGFSGSHDTTLELVKAGTYEAGALNSQVWNSRLEDGTITEDDIVLVLTSPEYHDYHWIVSPGTDGRLGEGTTQAITDALQSMHTTDAGKAVLELYSAQSIIPATAEDYAQIEQVATELNLLG